MRLGIHRDLQMPDWFLKYVLWTVAFFVHTRTAYGIRPQTNALIKLAHYRAEPSLDMLRGAPGLEHRFARRGKNSRDPQGRGLNLAARLIDRVHRSCPRFPEF